MISSKDKLIPISDLPNNKLGDNVEIRFNPEDIRHKTGYDLFILDSIENNKYHATYIETRYVDFHL